MKKIIAQGLSKTGNQIAILTLFIFLVSSCSSSNNVVSRKSFSKRKYTSGYFNSKRKIPRSKETHQAKVEFAEVNEIKLKSVETINSFPTPNISTSDLKRKELISKSEFVLELEQDKPNATSNYLSETDAIPLPDELFTNSYSTQEKESNSIQLEKRERKQRYGYSSLQSARILLIGLGAAALFGVLFLFSVPGTALYYFLAVMTCISVGVVGGCLFIMPFEYIFHTMF